MSSTVDNRVVEMAFNNKQFETGVKQSTDSLEGLKKSLDLTEAAKGFDSVNAASKNIKLGPIERGVQSISDKFSAFGVIGFTVLNRLTNAAMDFGKQLVSSIVTPVKMGFSEYETQINAIQTVLANTEAKGTTLEDVSAALNELNTYADKTIYNFTEMTRNIGTFTAAGVDLETSTAAIKGIANLAAVSGSTSQQASTAMYQLSQALSSGTVKLMDWNSVVNAGMGGQVFQDALQETARVSGIAIDDLIDKHGSFRETLQTGWLSSDVLLQTLQKFTGDLSKEQLITMGYTEEQITAILKLGETANDAATKVKTFTQLQETITEALQSGWTKSWEIIVGDFNEAKALFTEVSDVLGAMIGANADARNTLLQEWKTFGGREMVITSIRHAFYLLLDVLAPIKEAFTDIFPPKTGKDLALLTLRIREFIKGLSVSGETADKIKRIFKGVFSILDIFRMAIVAVLGAFTGFGSVVDGAGGNLFDFIARLGDFITGIRDAIKEGNLFTVWVQAIVGALILAKNAIVAFVGIAKGKFDELKTVLEPIIASAKEFGKVAKVEFGSVKEAIAGLFSADVLATVTEFTNKVKEIFSGLFDSKDMKAKTGDNVLVKFGDQLSKITDRFTKMVDEFKKVKAKVSPVIDNIKEKFGGFFRAIAEYLRIDFGQVVDGTFKAINAGIFAGILLAIKKFVSSGTGLMGNIGGVFEGFTGILRSASGILDGVRGSLEAWQSNLKAKTLMTIATAVALLSLSLIALSFIDSKKLAVSLGIITGLFADLTTSMAIFNKIGGGGKGSTSLIAMSVSILIMAGAMSIIAGIDEEAMGRGLKAMFALMAGMLAFSATSKKMGGTSTFKGAGGIAAFAISLLILTQAVEGMGKLKPEVMRKGLVGVGIMLTELALFLKVTDFDKMGISKGLGIAVLAGALWVMSIAVEKFGKMDVAKMQQGLIAIAAVLAELAIFSKVSGSGTNLIAMGIGMIIFSASMMILAEVLAKLGDIEWETLGKGLLTIAAVMAILAIGLTAMTGTLGGSAALIIAAGALMLLVPVLMALGQMSLIQIGTSLLMLAGVFAVLGVAGLLLGPLVPVLLGLGVALLLVGAAAALVGVGLLAFSAGLAALAVTGTAGALAIVAMVTILLGIIPIIIAILIESLIIFAKGIIKATPLIMKAVTEMLLGFMQVIIDITPKIVETLTVLLEALIKLIVDLIPDFVEAVLTLMLTLLQEIAAKMPEFVQAGFDILIGFLSGIRDNIAEVVTVVIEIVTEFLGAVAEKIPDIIQSGWDLMIAFIEGMADGIDKNMQPALDAIARLAESIVKGLAKGITEGAWRVIDALIDIAKDAWRAALDWLWGHSPSERFARVGETIPEGMALGIIRLGHKVEEATVKVAETAYDSVTGAIAAVADGLSGELDMDPTVRPVLDLTDIISGGKLIDDLLGPKTLNLVPAITSGMAVTTPQIDAQGNVTSQPAAISLTQNNYSPKALSRLEIYRQTRNQLLTLRELTL
jgi:tape measure domain-containing protein